MKYHTMNGQLISVLLTGGRHRPGQFPDLGKNQDRTPPAPKADGLKKIRGPQKNVRNHDAKTAS
jgi:hypothetical protein